MLGELTILWRSRSLIGSVSYLVHTANAVDVYVRLLLLHRLHFSIGGFKGGGQGAMPPKMPEVTRSPCQPKILVCSSTQNVQFKVELTGSGNRSLSSSYFFSFDLVF